MGKYIKLFETHSQYTAFTQTEDFILPNVSYCEDQTDVIHYNPLVPPETRLLITYNVQSAGDVKLYRYFAPEGSPSIWITGADNFDKIEVDGTEVSITNIDTNGGMYQLGAGQHVVAYTLTDDTTIVSYMFQSCEAITTVTIPEGVTTIGEGAFNSCTNLTTVSLSETIETIETCSFGTCENLDSASETAISNINPNALECVN